ncbi:ABC transporter substrate-binding protein [Streptomyces sp. NPDC091281]|uniref:ABC transporter substrate-binding protein n=1 Tax=Streptomyces sp. NPDC091281 TaxID=3365985 RepID=UPI0037F36C3F
MKLRKPARWRARCAAACVLAVAAVGCRAPGAPPEGEVLRIGTVSPIDSVNPYTAGSDEGLNAVSMVYPRLVQYGLDNTVIPALASGWSRTDEGRSLVLHLNRDARWSDGSALGAQDVVWSARTDLKFADGATASLASALGPVDQVTAVDSHTVKLAFERKAPSNILDLLTGFFVLPRAVWKDEVGKDGAGLLSFRPQDSLPMVSGGPFTITRLEEKGTTVYRPNPRYYGAQPALKAVTLTYYTNAEALVADLVAGNLDFVNQLPSTTADALRKAGKVRVTTAPGPMRSDLIFNSNPAKPRNRELLDPDVREALERGVDRQRIADVVFGGYATPYANLISPMAGDWRDPAIKPLPFDLDAANRALDALGYRRGEDGIRIAPATTGEHAQPAHRMDYGIITPGDLTFDVNRQFKIVQSDWAKLGVKVTQLPSGDTAQTFDALAAPDYKYEKADIGMWTWGGNVDPSFNLSLLTSDQLGNLNDTGFSDPAYDRLYRDQTDAASVAERRSIVDKLQQIAADRRPYIFLVNTSLISAARPGWSGFAPRSIGACDCYYADIKYAQGDTR